MLFDFKPIMKTYDNQSPKSLMVSPGRKPAPGHLSPRALPHVISVATKLPRAKLLCVPLERTKLTDCPDRPDQNL